MLKQRGPSHDFDFSCLLTYSPREFHECLASSYQIMPRTRTKYIWPPPTLTPHSAATLPRAPSYTTTAINGTSIDEPRAKKPKLESISSSSARSHGTERVADASGDWDPESGSAPPSMEVAFAAYMRMPVETQIKRYREWRRKYFFCPGLTISGFERYES